MPRRGAGVVSGWSRDRLQPAVASLSAAVCGCVQQVRDCTTLMQAYTPHPVADKPVCCRSPLHASLPAGYVPVHPPTTF